MMPRPITLFTGQWADLPLEDLARKAGECGFDGLELACWRDYFDVAQALEDPRVEALREAGVPFTTIGRTASVAGLSYKTTSSSSSSRVMQP